MFGTKFCVLWTEKGGLRTKKPAFGTKNWTSGTRNNGRSRVGPVPTPTSPLGTALAAPAMPNGRKSLGQEPSQVALTSISEFLQPDQKRRAGIWFSGVFLSIDVEVGERKSGLRMRIRKDHP